MKIVGIDPGETTGLVYYNDVEVPNWDFVQLGPLEHHEELWYTLYVIQPHIIVCEKFDHRANMAAKLMPLEYIGIVKLWSVLNWQNSSTELVMQSPSQAKGFWTNEKLKAVSLWKGNGLKHSMDATRHVLYYMMTNQLLPQEFLEALKSLG